MDGNFRSFRSQGRIAVQIHAVCGPAAQGVLAIKQTECAGEGFCTALSVLVGKVELIRTQGVPGQVQRAFTAEGNVVIAISLTKFFQSAGFKGKRAVAVNIDFVEPFLGFGVLQEA